MKKTYINPTVEVVTVQSQNLLSVSSVGFGASSTSQNLGHDDDADWGDDEY